jgi:hypothetical protein
MSSQSAARLVRSVYSQWPSALHVRLPCLAEVRAITASSRCRLHFACTSTIWRRQTGIDCSFPEFQHRSTIHYITMAASPSSSPRLPSPPPIAEDQLGPKSPIAMPNEHGELGHNPFEANASRRIRPGTKAAEMALGPPLVPLTDVRRLHA